MIEASDRRPVLSGSRASALIAIAVVSGIFFMVGALGKSPLRWWQAYLVNWIFWTGIAEGGVVFSCITEMSEMTWGRPLKRIAESFAAFLPVSFIMFLIMWPGMAYIYPWVNDPPPGLSGWMNRPFVFMRDGLSMLALYAVSFAYIYHSARPDFAAVKTDGPADWLRARLTKNWRGDEAEVVRGVAARRILAPMTVIGYAVVFSLFGFDLIMSIWPGWSSSLFGAYVFVVNFFLTLAVLAMFMISMKNSPAFRGVIQERHLHDYGKLLMAFAMLSIYFFWSQLMVIWYGNLPDETNYLILRGFAKPWWTIGWLATVGGMLCGFLLLISRRIKANPKPLFLVCLWIAAMMWLERFTLIAPSSWNGPGLPLGGAEVIVTAGFGSLFMLAFGVMFDRVPAMPYTDPVFTRKPPPHHVIGEPDSY